MSSTFLGLTSCPYLLASAVCRLPLLVLTPRQLPLPPPTARQLHLEASSSSEVSSTMQTSNSVSTIPPRIAYSTFYHLCVDYSFVSTTPYINIFWKYRVLFKISSMSTGYGPRILGRCRPTHSFAIWDSGPQQTSSGNLAMHPRSLDSSWRG